MNNKILIFSVFLILFSADSFGQSGGIYEIKQSVIASGGGQNSAGGNFSLDGTIGQATAGNSQSGSPFSLTSGFWNFTPSAPTAASVSVSGRVMTASGRGIRSVQITLTDASGNVRTAQTAAFGFYQFEQVAAGETYIITATGKRYTFSQPTQVLNILEDRDDVNFIGEPIIDLPTRSSKLTPSL